MNLDFCLFKDSQILVSLSQHFDHQRASVRSVQLPASPDGHTLSSSLESPQACFTYWCLLGFWMLHPFHSVYPPSQHKCLPVSPSITNFSCFAFILAKSSSILSLPSSIVSSLVMLFILKISLGRIHCSLICVPAAFYNYCY